jgi:hypothetical protein
MNIDEVKKEIDVEFSEKMAIFLTWYIRVGSPQSNEIIEYARSKGLYSIILQYDPKLQSSMELVVVSCWELNDDKDGILADLRKRMEIPFPIVGSIYY